MKSAFLSLGGNIGNRMENLRLARTLIKERCGQIVAASPVYESPAWGYRSAQHYLNQVIQLKTNLKSNQLLDELLKIEKILGRRRTHKRYSDRNIDIDILFYGQEVINLPGLQVPHPRLHQRLFVLKPLFDINKNLVHPLLNKSVQSLVKKSGDENHPVQVSPTKNNFYICVEGNIGSGKTTLARRLSEVLKARFLPEEFEKNHLLPLFYQSPGAYAFPLEYSFLISRFEQLKTVLSTMETGIVSDFSLYKCLWFAKSNLSKKEVVLFEKHFHAFSNHLRTPDAVIHLKSSTQNLQNNIRRRGRSFEKNIEQAYLAKVQENYKGGMKRLEKQVPVLEINIEKYGPGLEKKLVSEVLSFVKENFGW